MPQRLREANRFHAPMAVRIVRTNLGGYCFITYKIVNTHTGQVVGKGFDWDGAHAKATELAKVYVADLRKRLTGD